MINWLYKKLNPDAYWQREVFKKTKFKPGDYVKAVKEVWDKKTHQHVEKQTKAKIVGLSLERRCTSVIEHLARSEYIYTEDDKTYKCYDIETVDKEWEFDPETKGSVGFEKDLKDLLK